MSTLPRWTDERTAQLSNAVANENPVSRETIVRLADELETTPRSVSSKLRKMGVEVESATAAPKAFSDEDTAALTDFVEANSGALTYAQIAEKFENGRFTAKQIQGKVLSLELHTHVAPTPKAEVQKSYSDAEEAKVVEMAKAGAYFEDIAAAVGRTVPSVRGKALSLLRAGQIDAMPTQREVKGPAVDAFEALGDVSALTVAEIAEKLDKTPRGVKTMLTRRGVKVADYDGAAKAAKAAA